MSEIAASSCAHVNYGLDFIADRFLRSTAVTWSDNVLEVMAHLGMVAGFGRVSAYKHHRPLGDPVVTGLRYLWLADGDERTILDSQVDHVELVGSVFANWAKLLSNNSVVIEQVAELDAGSRALFGEKSSSVLLVPVFVDEHWWGFFGFEDEKRREWISDEVETLKAVATIYGSAIWRKRLEEELEDQKTTVEKQVQERTRQLEKARTDLEEAVRRAQEQKARLLASIQSLTMGFVMTDVDGKVMLLNDAVRRILAMHDGSLEHVGVIDEVIGNQGALVEQVSLCAAENTAARMDDVRYQDKYLDIWMTPISTLDGSHEVIGVVLLLDDVTEAKMLQQSRDEFFAVASHELRTPLTAIRGNASMMLDYFPEHMKEVRLREIVDDIHSSSKRLIDIVNEYLDVSRLEMDHVKLALEAVDLVPLVSGVMDSIAVTAEEKGLQFELQTQGYESLLAKADPRRVQQILLNLIGNAIKYTQQGGVYVKLVDEGAFASVIVYDTGPGIEQEEQERLFQKFSQLGDRAYQRHVKDSTGMGLYIAKLIAEAMDGRVFLERSEPGVGSGFGLQLKRWDGGEVRQIVEGSGNSE